MRSILLGYACVSEYEIQVYIWNEMNLNVQIFYESSGYLHWKKTVET